LGGQKKGTCDQQEKEYSSAASITQELGGKGGGVEMEERKDIAKYADGPHFPGKNRSRRLSGLDWFCNWHGWSEVEDTVGSKVRKPFVP